MVDEKFMKYNILFGSGEIDEYGTNIQNTITLTDCIYDKNVKVLSFTLNDLPLTKKFIKYYKIYRDEHVKHNNTHTHLYAYNYYMSRSQKNILSAKKEMNLIIDELTTIFNYKINSQLKLFEKLEITENTKYNSLHYIFETERKNLSDNGVSLNDRRIFLFEKINHLVHFLEPGVILSNSLRLVIRPTLQVNRYKLQDSDYADFSFPESGDLVCDYATVGKDLYACFKTNDIGLIKNNGVNQQIFLTDFVFIDFKKKQDSSLNFSKFYKWCKQNRVEKYVDITLPKYKPGRHILGKIDQPIYSAEDFYNEIQSKTPKVLGSYLSDDLGNPILTEYL
jgi:hypothetical protein